MAKTIPLASHEVRWFFEGKTNQHESLECWFETTAPIQKSFGVGPLARKGRLEDLLMPGSDDIGIKLREGALQIKGRVSSLDRSSESIRLFIGLRPKSGSTI